LNKLKDRNIEVLWEKYFNLIKKIGDDDILSLINKLDQNLIESTYSMKVSEPFCGIGGLVEYILEFAKNAKKINDSLELNIDTRQLIKICCIAELGRIGIDGEKRFVESLSDWHKEKLGQYYNWNENLQKYKTAEMSLYYIINENIKLKWEEINAILLLGDFETDLIKFYGDNKTNLATCLLFARDITLRKEIASLKLISE